jgi:hypothetical protein
MYFRDITLVLNRKSEVAAAFCCHHMIELVDPSVSKRGVGASNESLRWLTFPSAALAIAK